MASVSISIKKCSPRVPPVYYISSSSGSDSTGVGTISKPFKTFSANLATAGALEAGALVYFKRGDTWVGSEAYVNVNTSGIYADPIILDAYGSGDDPVFAADPITTAGWSYTGANSIYTIGSQTQTYLKYVVQGTTYGLGRWAGSVTTLPEGTWLLSGSTLYVRCWGNTDPAVSDIRIGNYMHNTYRGLVRGGAGYGHIYFKNMKVLGSNSSGFSASGDNVQFFDCTAIGTARDGVVFNNQPGENAINGRWWRGDISYCSCNAGVVGGAGQAFTTESSGTWVVDANIHDNYMEGIDFLDYNTDTNCVSGGALRCTVARNGRWQSTDCNAPGIYIDGARDIYLYGNVITGNGRQSGSTNDRAGIAIGTEHPIQKPISDIYVINNLVHGVKGECIAFNNASHGTASINSVKVINNSFLANSENGYDMCWYFNTTDCATNGSLYMRNNLFYTKLVTAGAWTNAYMSNPSHGSLDMDYNVYYKDGGTTIYSNAGSGGLNFTNWKIASEEDSNSAFADPKLTTFNNDTPDVHLLASSSCFDTGTLGAFTPPAWLPADVFPYGGYVSGTTVSAGTLDITSSTIDIGYHYPV